MNEICTISDITEEVLNRWDVCEENIPAIIDELARLAA